LRLEALTCLALLTVLPLSAQNTPAASSSEAPTSRQSLARAETLFSQGHLFTAEEFQALDAAREDLVASGDSDLAADLDLLKLAAVTTAGVEEARGQAKGTLAEDGQLWEERERFLRNKEFWRGARDVGLITFAVSTAATLLLTTVVDKRASNDGLQWALAGTGGTMFISLFPLLWGEARQ